MWSAAAGNSTSCAARPARVHGTHGTHRPSDSSHREQPRQPSSPRPSSTKSRRRKRKSLDQPRPAQLQPAFILSPLVAMPSTDYSSPEERPRRAVSSPQLLRTRGRSDSASSSASLTATEDNYARLPAARYERASASASTSTSRIPNGTYPPLWAIAQAHPASPRAMGMEFEDPTSGPSDGPSDSEDEGEDCDADDLIFVSRASSSTTMATNVSSGLRNRRSFGGGPRRKEPEGLPRMVTTARGQPCAGETETELDEFPQRLPTSRNIASRPVVPLLVDYLVPFLFQVTRFLSIVPATFGTLYNMYRVLHPLSYNRRTTSIDYVVCALWSILTGFQCLCLTTGLLLRWKAYYTTPSTLIRLVALQCICWPATHFTLTIFDHTQRPVACWALIGTTTCLSRSVQLWVTSNLYYMPAGASSVNGGANLNSKVLRAEGSRLGPRRWDWAEVIVECALPAGVLYFLSAWGMILKDELEYMR